MNVLPVVEKNLRETDWRLAIPDSYSSLPLEDELLEEVGDFLDAPFSNFYFQTVLAGCPFLCALFYDEKTVRLASPGLRQELFLISLLEEDQHTALFSFTKKIQALNVDQFPSAHEFITRKGDLPQFLEGPNQDSRYREVVESMDIVAKKLFSHIQSHKPTVLERISDKALTLAASYALFRIHLLKFVAILPSLDHDTHGTEVKRMLLEALRRMVLDHGQSKRLKKQGEMAPLPVALVFLFKTLLMVCEYVPPGLLSRFVRFSIRTMAKRFIAGESIEKAKDSMNYLRKSGRDATFDQLGELVVSKKEANYYRDEVLKIIRGLSLHIPPGERNGAGINRAHVSLKVSALCSDFKPHAFDYTYADTAPRLVQILVEAKKHKVFINIDAEHYTHRDTVFGIYKKVLLETPELQDYGDTGPVVQAYLKDAYVHLEEVISLARERNLPMPVRLVKGAYWDAETIEAQAHGHVSFEFLNKEETDLNLRQLVFKIFESHPHLLLCIGSHNLADHCFCEVLKEKYFPHLPPIEHQCLHGTAEGASLGLTKMGQVVRNYIPVGPLITGMAYLVRRIMENASQVGVLTAMRTQENDPCPEGPEIIHARKKREKTLVREPCEANLSPGFVNIPPSRLYLPKELEAAKKAMEVQREIFSTEKSFPLKGNIQKIFSPSSPKELIGTIPFASLEDVHRAVDISQETYKRGHWENQWQRRLVALIQTACLLTARRMELASLMVHESGKTITESLGDVDEAVDFLNFYAREEKCLQENNQEMHSRGPVAVVAPWNFPLAIPCGMVAAPLAAGNTVILKSAEQTPLVAQALVNLFHRGGVDPDALIHLPGPGESIGAALVQDTRISGVVFTGSKEVGLRIQKSVSKRIYHNPRTKESYPAFCIAEMGGKNAIIVTDNAELDETLAGILYSAFGHSGQKCSAASRLLVSSKIKKKLKERLQEAIWDLPVGPSQDFSTTVNPLISAHDKERIKRQARECAHEVEVYGGEILVDRSREEHPGHLVGPALFELNPVRAREEESFARRELFGPILHLIPYNSLEDALAMFNATDYGLTGGIFAQSQDDIDFLSSRMEVGNIYINRSITGARVAIEPFGGFKLSGTGPKAGGYAYVAQFHRRMMAISRGKSRHPGQCRKTHRIQKILRALEKISLAPGLPQRQELLSFYSWAKGNMEKILHCAEENRPILGQISFNDYSLRETKVILISKRQTPHPTTLFYLLSALCVGADIHVVVEENGADFQWKHLREAFQWAGIAGGGMDIDEVAKGRRETLIPDDFTGSVIIDGEMEAFQLVAPMVFRDLERPRGVRRILSPLDAPPLGDIPSFVRAFSRPRSFAINTMRYGAPMDIEF